MAVHIHHIDICAAAVSFHATDALPALVNLEAAGDEYEEFVCDATRIMATSKFHRALCQLGGRDSGGCDYAPSVAAQLRAVSVNRDTGFWLIVHFLCVCMRSVDGRGSWVNDGLRVFFEGVCAMCGRVYS